MTFDFVVFWVGGGLLTCPTTPSSSLGLGADGFDINDLSEMAAIKDCFNRSH